MINVSGITTNLSSIGVEIINKGIEPVNVYVTTKTIGYLEGFVFSFCIYMTAILFHEYGHYLLLRKHCPQTKIYAYMIGWLPYVHTGIQEDYNNLTSKQKIEVYAAGIIIGLVPIFLAGLVAPLYWVLFGPYIVGALTDMKMIWRNMQQ